MMIFTDQKLSYGKCAQCKYSMEFQLMDGEIQSYMLQELSRKIHLEHWCSKLQSGEIVIG